MVDLINIRLHGRGKAMHFSPAGLALHQGEEVIVETVHGMEYGFCTTDIHAVDENKLEHELKPVIRIATEQDKEEFADIQLYEAEVFTRCLEMIKDLELQMKLIDVECMFDRQKLMFYFTADNRVDFRQLVKDLATTFKKRIELRQIGVRDEARLIGGLGRCGRELCCRTHLKNFVPVSMKMVKEQHLSMNPAKVSGVCGRLLCCLTYEHEAYIDANKRLPSVGSRVKTIYGEGDVIGVSILREQVKVRVNTNDESQFYLLPVAEIEWTKPNTKEVSEEQVTDTEAEETLAKQVAPNESVESNDQLVDEDEQDKQADQTTEQVMAQANDDTQSKRNGCKCARKRKRKGANLRQEYRAMKRQLAQQAEPSQETRTD